MHRHPRRPLPRARQARLTLFRTGVLGATSALVAAGMAVPVAANAQPDTDPDLPPGLSGRAAAAAADLLAEVDGKAVVTVDEATGGAASVRLTGKTRPADAPPRVIASQWLAEHGDVFGVGPGDRLVHARQLPDGAGGTVVAFEQRYRGLPVFGGELKVRVGDGAVTSAHGVVAPDIAVSTTPGLLPAQAADRAVEQVRAHLEGQRSDRSLSARTPRLTIFRDGLLAGRPGANRLAYEVEVSDAARTLREVLHVDATTGAVLNRFSEIHDALSRDVYDGSGTLVWTEGDPEPADPAWKRVADGAEETYNLIGSLAGRDSYDGAGARMRSHSGVESSICPNAWWDGTATYFCAGMDTDDVIAHEWGHAYTEYTSGLVYAWQPGALNESYSDVWGEAVDQLNDWGADTPATSVARLDETCTTHTGGGSDPSLRWLEGEDSVGGALRDMWHPTCVGLPGKVTDKQYVVPGDFWDNGGVHINSSVPNHAFALLTDGGVYDDYVIRGLGLAKTAHIWWTAGTLLTSTSRFPAFADALETACVDLVGDDLSEPSVSSAEQVPSGQQITLKDCGQLGLVIEAVELRTNVYDGTNPGPARPYLDTTVGARCPDGAETVADSEDFESGSLEGWTADHVAQDWNNPQPDWAIVDTLPAGAMEGSTKAAYAGFITSSFYNEGTFRLASPELTLGDDPEPRLSFDHWFYFHTSFGGGINRGGNVKISVNDGDWTLIPESAFLKNGYLLTMPGPYPEYTPPLAGERVFANLDGNSARAAWARSLVDLSDLAEPGDSVRLRFDVKHDYNHFSIPEGAGWYVDNVTFYTCTDEVGPTASPWHFDRANAAGWNADEVVVRWRWSDAYSGIDPDSCTRSTTVSVEGIQTVEASCSDLAGNTSTASYDLKIDRTGPVVVGPTVEPGRPLEGLEATATFSASDALSGMGTTTCAASFAVDTSVPGPQEVTCTATDVAGAGTTAVGSYYVVSASEGISELIAQVNALDLPRKTSKSLVSLLQNAKKNRDLGKDADCMTQLRSFINQVNAQSGKAIPTEDASDLVEAAERIIASIQASPAG